MGNNRFLSPVFLARVNNSLEVLFASNGMAGKGPLIEEKLQKVADSW